MLGTGQRLNVRKQKKKKLFSYLHGFRSLISRNRDIYLSIYHLPILLFHFCAGSFGSWKRDKLFVCSKTSMILNKVNLDTTTEYPIYQHIWGDHPVICCQNSCIGNHPLWIGQWFVLFWTLLILDMDLN